MLIVLEGLVMSFWLLLICVVGIAKEGPVGLVNFYEKDAQERVVELGLTIKERIKKAATISGIALIVPLITVVPAIVYLYNGVTGFWDGFIQLLSIYMIMNVFDRLFIDEWWVCHTKAWFIPGTEDLMPYITWKVRIRKWVMSLILFPLAAAIIAGVMQVILG
ncbi:MAG: hypothetical protein IKW81_07285 [Pseudobutyrivibrio sp.]|nr:hypothetical protein [Pseudobutyrivibrio sp.]